MGLLPGLTYLQYQQALTQRRQQIESSQAAIQAARMRQATQRELRQPTGTALQLRESIRTSQRTFEQAKAEQLGLVGAELQKQVQLEKEFVPIKAQYEAEQARVSSEQAYVEEFERGKKAAERDKSPWQGMTKIEREGYRAGREELSAYKERKEQLTNLTNKLKGTGVSLQQYVLPNFDLNKLSVEQQEKFVTAGLATRATTVITPTQSPNIDTSQLNLQSKQEPTFLEKIGGGIVAGAKAVWETNVKIGERVVSGWEKILTPPAKVIVPKVIDVARTVGGTIGSVPIVSPTKLIINKEVELSNIGTEIQRVQQGISAFGVFAAEGAKLSSRQSLISRGIGELTGRPNLFSNISKQEGENKAKLTKFAVESVPYIVAPEISFGADIISAGTTYKNKNEIINQALIQGYKDYEKTTVPEGQVKLTKQEWVSQMRPQLEKQIEQGTSFQTILAVGALTGIEATKAYKYIFTPKEIFRGGGWSGVAGERAIAEIGAPESGAVKIGSKTYGRSVVILEPVITKTSSRFMSWFGEPAITKIISPARAIVKEWEAQGEGFISRVYKIGKGGAGKVNLGVGFTKIFGGKGDWKPYVSAEITKLRKNILINIEKGIAKKEYVGKGKDFLAYNVKTIVQRQGGIDRTVTAFLEYVRPGEGIKVITGGGAKTPLELTFGAGQAIIPKVVSNIKIPKINVGISTVSKNIEENFPFMVGGTGLKVDFKSLGTYERTTGGQIPGTAPTGVIRSATQENVKITEIPANILDTKTELRDIYWVPVPPVEIPKPVTITGQTQDQENIFNPPLPPPPQPEPIQDIIQTNIQIPRVQIGFPAVQDITKLKFPPGGLLPEEPGKPKKKTSFGADIFEAFVRKKGKDVSIGGFESLGTARGKLVEKLRGTLAASGFITKRGKKLKSNELGLYSFEFAPSKKESFRIVERKERRLKKGTTGKEIQMFRKGSKKKGGSLFNI